MFGVSYILKKLNYQHFTCMQFHVFLIMFYAMFIKNGKKKWFQLILLFFTQCVSIIESCQKKAELLINDLDLHVLVHTAFGKLLMMPSYYY